MFRLLKLFTCVEILLLSASATASQVNVSIDDTSIDITYAPNGTWSPAPGCTSCAAQPDANDAYGGTWHDVAYNPSNNNTIYPSASVNFDGTAVYVYCIMARTTSTITGRTDLTFYIDGQLAGTYYNESDSTTGANYSYNFIVYANQSLSEASHTLDIQVGHSGSQFSIALLDRIVYTQGGDATTTTSTSASASNTSTIVNIHHTHVTAIVLPCILVPLFLGLIALFIYRRKHYKALNGSGYGDSTVEPYSTAPSTIQTSSVSGSYTVTSNVPPPAYEEDQGSAAAYTRILKPLRGLRS